MNKTIVKAPELPDTAVADARGIIGRFRDECDTAVWAMAQSLLTEAQGMIDARRAARSSPPPAMPVKLLETVRSGLNKAGFKLAESWNPAFGDGFDDMLMTRAMSFGIGGKELSCWMSMRLEYHRSQARYLYETNSHYHGLIETFVNVCVGADPAVSFAPRDKGKSESPQTKAARDYWDRKIESPDFDWMETCSEFVRRCERDGEAALRRIYAKPGAGELRIKDGQPVYWRFMEPDYIMEPPGAKDIKGKSTTYGIITPDDDSQTIEGFIYCPGGDIAKPKTYEAADVVWRKLGTDANVKRGRPSLYPVTPWLRSRDDFLGDRKILNRVRTAIALVIKSGSATPGQANARAEKHKSGSVMTYSTDVGGAVTKRPVNTQQMQPGSIVYVGKDDEWNMLDPSTGAGEAASDYRLMSLAVCAGVNLPEYMVSWDASNANLASMQVSEAPATINQKRKQKLYANCFAEIVWRDIEVGMSNPPGRHELLITVEQPDIVVRDPESKTSEAATLVESKIMSRRTAQVRLGLDPDIEDQQIESDNVEPPDAAAELLDRPPAPNVGKAKKKAGKPK